MLLLTLCRVDQVEESVVFGVQQQQQETHVLKALWNQRPACLRTVYSGNEGWLRRKLLSFALHLCTKLKTVFMIILILKIGIHVNQEIAIYWRPSPMLQHPYPLSSLAFTLQGNQFSTIWPCVVSTHQQDTQELVWGFGALSPKGSILHLVVPCSA